MKDFYVRRWETAVAVSWGPVPGSRLCARKRRDGNVSYDIEVQRGEVALAELLGKRWEIAKALEVDGERLLLEPVDRRDRRRARLTIVEAKSYPLEPCFAEDLEVEGGTIRGLGWYVDAQGELDVTMFNRGVAMPTLLVGQSKTGRTTTANHLAVAALSSGRLNLMLIDPKGTSPEALRSAARLVFVGADAAREAAVVLEALVSARWAFAAQERVYSLPSTPAEPGWMVLHDDFDEVAGDSACVSHWIKSLKACRMVGLWPVVVGERDLGSREVREAFPRVLMFRSDASTPDEVPHLYMRPRELPANSDGGALPGFVIPGGSELTTPRRVPVQCTWLPDDDEQLDAEPPLRLGAALARHAQWPDVPPFDLAALTELLGEPVDGRWVVGPEGTHNVSAALHAQLRGRCTQDGSRTATNAGDISETGCTPGDVDRLVRVMAKRAGLVEVRREEGRPIYTLVLQPGSTFEAILGDRDRVASALGVEVERLVFERMLPIGDRHALRLTVIEPGAAAEPRPLGEPMLECGELVDVGRYVDGQGTPSVSAWSPGSGRMTPLALVGRPGSGRSNALRVLASGVLSRAPMKIMVIDPSGFREPELRRHATVLLSGSRQASLAWPVLRALTATRARYAAEHEFGNLTPTGDHAGWMVVFTDVARMSSPSVEMLDFLRDAELLGLWPVAVADSLWESEWGSTRVRERFGGQVVAFHGGVPKGLDGAMGLDVRQATLPIDGEGRPVPGYAVLNFGARPGVPMRFDYVPGLDGVELSAEERTARDRLRHGSGRGRLSSDDRQAIASVLGEPVDGRWHMTDEEPAERTHRPRP